MILVVGQLPTPANSRCGMMQRIAAIDRLIDADERVYVEPHLEPLAFPPFDLTPCGPGRRYGRPNRFDREHLDQVMALGRQAHAIIVHSAHWARYVLPLYDLGHVVTDLHGVVPEERQLLGDLAESEILGRVERFVLQHGRLALTVTDVMAAHLRAKYPSLSPRLIALPVLSATPARAPVATDPSAPITVVYPGGLERWQNVPRMLQAIATTRSEARVELFTADVKTLRAEVAAHGLEKRVTVASARPDDMPNIYARMQFGFVLRDDHILNRAACPTKLQEYLAHGILPIVQSSAIGDFEALGYRTVSVEAFEEGRLPRGEGYRDAVSHNLRVWERLADKARAGEQALREVLETPVESPEQVSDLALAADVLLHRMNETREHLKRYPVNRLLRIARRLRL